MNVFDFIHFTLVFTDQTRLINYLFILFSDYDLTSDLHCFPDNLILLDLHSDKIIITKEVFQNAYESIFIKKDDSLVDIFSVFFNLHSYIY